MKKIVFLMAFTFVFVTACGKKEATDNSVKTEEAQGAGETAKPEIKEPLTDADKYEGKVVQSEGDEWFVIKDGERYRAMSEPATTDYLKSIEDGNNHVYNKVPNQTLEQFPIVGEILPGVKFKRDNK